MGTINHKIRGGRDLQLAMIEGTPVSAWCGIRLVPEVQLGTSGRADVPGAPNCDRCKEIVDNWREFIRLKDEKNRLLRKMRVIEKLQRTLHKEWREERGRSTQPAPQFA